MRQEEQGGIYLAVVRNSKPSTEVTASLDYHSGNFLARQSTHLAYGHHDCNVGDCPRREAGQGQGQSPGEHYRRGRASTVVMEREQRRWKGRGKVLCQKAKIYK